MNGKQRLQVIDAQGLEFAVWHVTGVGDHGVDTPVVIKRRSNDRLATFWSCDSIIAGDGLAAFGFDFRGNVVRETLQRLAIAPGSWSAEVVDHELTAAPRNLGCVGSTETITRSGDDNDLSIE